MTKWSVYLVRRRDGALYTGSATDVPRRLAEHRRNGSRCARSLRGRGPLRLVLRRLVGDRGAALRVEAAIKRLAKGEKERLVANPVRLRALVARCRRGGGRGPIAP